MKRLTQIKLKQLTAILVAPIIAEPVFIASARINEYSIEGPREYKVVSAK